MSKAYGKEEREQVLKLTKFDAVQSMSGIDRCYDNARMKSFFATLKKERLYQIDTSKMKLADVKTVVYRFGHRGAKPLLQICELL